MSAPHVPSSRTEREASPAGDPGMADGLDAFMATMVVRSHPVPSARAVTLVREHYGIESQPTRLTGERDENFRLTAADGAQYVLKIANPAESPAIAELANAALLHIEEADPAIPCPRLVRTREGAAEVRFRDDAGRERTARVLTYLPGRLLGASVRSRPQRAACGRLGGRLSCALRDFQHPAAHRAIVWDVRHAAYMQRLLDELPLFPFRRAAVELLRDMVPRIEEHLPPLRRQIVHNDLNPRNLLVDPTDEAKVLGVIDFGDLTHTALIGDVAVAAAELVPQECADPASARECIREVAIAYHEYLPLEARELAALGTLAAARLLMNVVVHEWHVHHNPANDHYAALDPHFMRARLEIAAGLALEEIRL